MNVLVLVGWRESDSQVAQPSEQNECSGHDVASIRRPPQTDNTDDDQDTGDDEAAIRNRVKGRAHVARILAPRPTINVPEIADVIPTPAVSRRGPPARDEELGHQEDWRHGDPGAGTEENLVEARGI